MDCNANATDAEYRGNLIIEVRDRNRIIVRSLSLKCDHRHDAREEAIICADSMRSDREAELEQDVSEVWYYSRYTEHI